jgi:hypothetical protein
MSRVAADSSRVRLREAPEGLGEPALCQKSAERVSVVG